MASTFDNLADSALLGTLLALLPGFLTAEIVGLLVLREERSVFDRIVQALIYTLLAHVLWSTLAWIFPDRPAVHLVGLALCAVFWGAALTWAINNGQVHDLLRSLRLTKTASRPNEWYDAFYEKQDFVTLHLKDGRRIFGWPLIYPVRPDKGHLLLQGAKWLLADGGKTPEEHVDYLIDVRDVQFVEFIPQKEGVRKYG